jgi:branched-chain amino acid transport system ATP-binding protein
VAVRAGKVTIAGQDFTGATPAQVLGAGVAHVPEGRRLFSAMSVEDNLGMGAHMRSDEAGIRRDLAQIYELFPILGDRRRQEAGTLSGGEQQMCAIGRGIMSRPKLLMIDELSLGLAPKAVEQLSAALVRINAQENSRSCLSNRALAALNYPAALRHRPRSGRLVGRADMVSKDPKVREAYLGEL